MRDPVRPPQDGKVATQGSARDASAVQVETFFALARRHDLPFSVVVVRPLGRTTAARAREIVEAETRLTDLLSLWPGTGGLVVFCPATPAAGTQNLVQRLRARAGDLRLGIGSASFRDDAFTLDEVLSCAAQRACTDGGADDAGAPGIGLDDTTRIARARESRRLGSMLKRSFDLLVVVAMAPLLLPLIVAIAVAVKLSDPRAPVFFLQQRTGFRGQRFELYKFRTMVREAERLKARLRTQNERSWPDFKIENDPRITRLGGWLRATSLDELPQLWNVIRGDMSLVGPRPTSFPPQTYQAWQTARLDAVPGITGLWQVEGRNGSDFTERMRLDLRYIENRNFFYDLKILLRTLPILWRREGH